MVVLSLHCSFSMVAHPDVLEPASEDDNGPLELLQVGKMLPHALLTFVHNVVDGLLKFVDVLVKLLVVFLLVAAAEQTFLDQVGLVWPCHIDLGHGQRDQVSDSKDIEFRLAY